MPQFHDVKVILTDIEGTTSSISFVKDVLFPYAEKKLPAFLRQHHEDPTVQQHIQASVELEEQDGNHLTADNIDGVIECLLHWIRDDKKATPLKALQGMVWKQGYENGDYQAHMYPDATARLKQWYNQGLPLYVYSSGSIQAQKLFYGYSQDGDLLPLFSGHFDTTSGGKRDQQSYRNILADLQKQHDIQAGNVLFLSDLEEELDAAYEVGMQTVWIQRDATKTNSRHTSSTSFSTIVI
ncbi:2,3-diketo-5-methylthio-1-phosphopentane phosphatase [Thalassolituus sp. HI0120]|nr:2,3-diketo-5-methylthio-1-phosphopentane phosphatase [Thalassolituus sp. HI0120]KZZ44589.1 2,3-diketo-5-methylthio-1-phosphopentane phosphatase [Thalassolituus sp. HI0120]